MANQSSRFPSAGEPNLGGGEIRELDSRVGAQIRSKRMGLGLSADRLAEALGVTATRVLEWESGARRVGGEHLRMIAELMGARPEAFFETGGSDEMPPMSHPRLFDYRYQGPGPSVDDCVRLVRAFRAITDAEAREAILALVVALSPDPMSQN